MEWLYFANNIQNRPDVEKGVRAPEDVVVIGHDDLPFSKTLGLTSMSYPVRIIAGGAVQLLMGRLEANFAGKPRTLTVHGELHVRKSVVKPTVKVLL